MLAVGTTLIAGRANGSRRIFEESRRYRRVNEQLCRVFHSAGHDPLGSFEHGRLMLRPRLVNRADPCVELGRPSASVHGPLFPPRDWVDHNTGRARRRKQGAEVPVLEPYFGSTYLEYRLRANLTPSRQKNLFRTPAKPAGGVLTSSALSHG